MSIVAALMMVVGVAAQGVKPLPELHVEGKWLVDTHGNHVVLHGVMDTPSAWFNGGRWGWDYDDAGMNRCLDYFEKMFTALEQTKCTIFRLHLEPAWTNNNSYTYPAAKVQPAECGGESNIKHFQASRLRTYLNKLFFPLAKKAMNHGMYVVMRPPGVCPGDLNGSSPKNLKVNDYYQAYLMEVWDIVSKNDSVLKYSGQIGLELANEPINIYNAAGNNTATAMRDYFQPVVDRIRANGFTGVIWVPGTGYQSNYRNYKSNPVQGYNIGYAVHDYPGWYNTSDDNANSTTKINSFHDAVPVVDTNPIFISEVDWSPIKEPKEVDHYNEMGQPTYKNLGTWATATTSKWGKAYKAMLDRFKNISMTLTHPHDFIDLDQMMNGVVTPAFGGNPEACAKACWDWYADYYKVDWAHADNEGSDDHVTCTSLTPEATSINLMVNASKLIGSKQMRIVANFKDGSKREVGTKVKYESDNTDVATVDGYRLLGVKEGEAHVTATYIDPKGNEVKTTFKVVTSFFPMDNQYIDCVMDPKNVSGLFMVKSNSKIFRPGPEGIVGWRFGQKTNMSGYRYLVVKLKQKNSCDAHVVLYMNQSLNANYCYASEKFGDNLRMVIDLKNSKYTTGTNKNKTIHASQVYNVAIWGNGNGMAVVDDVYLTNNEDYSKMTPTAIVVPVQTVPEVSNDVYTLQGVKVGTFEKRNELPAGVYVSNGRKFVVNQK